jgi:hypothetical protein
MSIFLSTCCRSSACEKWEEKNYRRSFKLKKTSNLSSILSFPQDFHLENNGYYNILCRSAFKDFLYGGAYLFAIQTTSDMVMYQMEVPTLDKIKKKIVLILRAKLDRNVELTD